MPTDDIVHVFVVQRMDPHSLSFRAILHFPSLSSSSSSSSLPLFMVTGWFCGCIRIVRKEQTIDASALSSVQGLPITREWFDGPGKRDFQVEATATPPRCVIVVEKEGIYNRLSEDRFFERFPCVLVTGKGFPDLATRALVWTLHHEVGLPVVGLCDCNPYGIGVLHTYHAGSDRIGIDGGNRYSVPIGWLGLRPSHVRKLRAQNMLPNSVYQQLTDQDRKRLQNLSGDSHPFHADCIVEKDEHGNQYSKGDDRLDELLLMQESGIKVELEALHWLGLEYVSDWLEETFLKHDSEEDELAIL